tara:strand:+ start:96 stop:275 length:180 start_codon:yes stop_codon:yes gene_type:complete
MKRISIRITKEQFLRLSAYQHHLLALGSHRISKQEIIADLLEGLLKQVDDQFVALGETQ